MKKFGKIILILLIVFIAGTMIFFSSENNQIRFIRYLDSFNNGEKEVVQSQYISGDGIRYINGRYLLWNGEKITVSDETGKILWERTFLMDEAVLDIMDNLISVYDKLSGEIIVFNLNGQVLAQIQEDLPIFYFKTGKNGYFVHIKEEARELLKIYHRNGEHKKNLIFTKEFPIDYRLEDNSAIVTLLLLDNDKLSTKIVSFKENDEEELLLLEDRIIVKVEDMGDNSLIVTDTGIYMYENGEAIWGRDFQLLQDVFVDGMDIYVIYGENLRILDKEGNIVHQETFGMDYDKIYPHGKYIILRGEKDILVFQHMELVATASFDTAILHIQSQFNDLVVTTEKGVNIMRIENKKNETKEE